MTGMVTEIERFALNDGPGIRTTVFLKGCDMNCAWCHNPETIRAGRDLHDYAQNCIGCYKCVSVCPSKAHKRIDGAHRFFPNLCIQCGKCAKVCYAGAMVMSGEPMTVEQIMAQVAQDKPYYTDSKGGVTLSGGEVLCQTPFAMELADACHAQGISVGLETNLNTPFEKARPLLEKADLIMCDLKLWDSVAHRRWTGVDNAVILQNIRELDSLNIPYIVRTPLIPGATDSDANITAIATFLKPCQNLMYYELLNFNPLGRPKYASLMRPYPFAEAKPLPRARMLELLAVAQSEGIPARMDN
ncbi:MAG TPA: glycyl-radical enzyme activating protein [Candidatus Limiplasma sp.]|nr:glycyl-radical enzyme activating protein [Candidatus Limiplasma sp.]